MPRYLRRWSVALLCLQLSCAGLPFFKKDHLTRGSRNYQTKDYSKAITSFNKVLKKEPGSLIAYRYLYLCYKATGDEAKASYCLLKQIELKTTDINVYRLTYDHFRTARDSKRCFEIALAAGLNVPRQLDQFVKITRDNLAFLLAGASSRPTGKDHLAYVEKAGLMKRFPDGNFYAQDRVTLGNLIITLAEIVPEPRIQPLAAPSGRLRIDRSAFYYHPASKLVASRVMEPAELGNTEEYVSLTTVVNALNRLRKVVNF